jgi:excisionase family DNA binding protein
MDEIYEIVKALNRLKDHVGELTKQIAFLSKSPSQQLTRKWLDTEAVCRILRVSDRTLMKMRNEGALPFTRVRRRILYRASDIQDWLEKRVKPVNSEQ